MATVAGILLANTIIIVDSLESWEKMVLGVGPAIFIVCLVLSIVVLVLIYFGRVGIYRRERAVLLVLVLLLAVTAGAVSAVFADGFNSVGSANSSVAISLIFGYGTLVVAFGIAAIAANLLSNLFKPVR